MTRVVLVRLSSMGDVAQALPVAVHLAHCGLEVAWLVEERFAPLLRAARIPDLEVVPWRRGLAGLAALARRGRGQGPLLDLQGNWKSGLVAAVFGAAPSFGLHPRDLRERGNLLFHRRRAPRAAGPHVLDRARALIRAAGLPEPEVWPPPPYLEPAARPDDRVERLFAAASAPPLVLVRARRDDPRNWPANRARELAARWPGPVLALYGPSERPEPELAAFPRIHNESPDPAFLIALGARLAATGGAAVGPDVGPLHVLHAAGADVLALFGPQDPERTGPIHGRTLTTGGEPSCRPCLARRCRHPQGPICMDHGADRILEILQGRTEQGAARPAPGGQNARSAR